MHFIESTLLKSVSQYPDMPLVIAYSGGVDSQVLLHALAILNQTKRVLNPIVVCHVNHGISKNSAAWQAFAEKACSKLRLSLKVCQVNVQAQPQQSLEALARDARYQALHAINIKPSLIITGHHCDDQAETFLLALKRGSGLKGLSAMIGQTRQGKDVLLRPLLNITRAQILEYAQHLQLSWVEDESNTDTCFDRNFLRNDIIPLLINRWPSIVNTINRSSDHCREGQLLLDELAADDLNHCQYDNKSLSVEPLKQLSKSRFNNLIRYFLAQQQCLMPSTDQLAQLYLQLNAANDKTPTVKVGEHYLRRYKGVLYLTTQFEDVSNWQIELDLSNNESCIELPDHLGKLHIVQIALDNHQEAIQRIKVPVNTQKVTVRLSHNNPSCLPDYRNHSRSLKKVLQELNIPTWQRKRIPFLYYDDEFVAAIGFFVCKAYVPQESEPSLRITWAS